MMSDLLGETKTGIKADEAGSTSVIEATGLGKTYLMNQSLGHWLMRGLRKNDVPSDRQKFDAVPALQDVSFAVAKGEAFGVIGRNGAGKSTLLQILAGTLQPSQGQCRIRGRVTALLELGSGFNPEFTGRENILLAGSILGISRAEMEQKSPEIERFADVGSFIDQPVKTYSTGMMMRVAFAVAISVQPDVLIIDEALSVGDILFQQKCSRRLHELSAAGVTLLVVTHDLSFVLNMCQRALWLDNGRVRFLGEAGACVREYVTAMAAISGNSAVPSDDHAALNASALPSSPELCLDDKQRLGDGGVRVSRAWLLQGDGSPGSTFHVGDWTTVVILLSAVREVTAVSGGCEVRNRHGQVVFATGLRVAQRLIAKLGRHETCAVTIRFRLELQPGQYTIDLGCGAGTDGDNTWDRVHNAAVLELSNPPHAEVVHGLVRLPYEIKISRVDGELH